MSKGCFPKLLSWVQENIDIVGGLGIGVALFQVGQLVGSTREFGAIIN